MKKIVILVSLLICSTVENSLATPSVPVLSVTTTGVHASLSWTAASDAAGYRVLYAPYPYVGPETIGSIDMGAQTSLSVDLWSGAAYYVVIEVHDQEGSCSYSNLEIFFTSALTYDDALSYTASGTYSQTGDTIMVYFTTSNFPDGGGPYVNVPLDSRVITLTKTTLEFLNYDNE